MSSQRVTYRLTWTSDIGSVSTFIIGQGDKVYAAPPFHRHWVGMEISEVCREMRLRFADFRIRSARVAIDG